MKKHKKSFLIFIVTFTALFIFRLAYGYIQHPELDLYSASSTYITFDNTIRNIATQKMKNMESNVNDAFAVVEQKYEKISTIVSKTTDFKKNETKVRSIIEKFDALIQYEKSKGNQGERVLEFSIGVNPEKFDSMVGELKKVGKIESIEVNKIDKTNEYKDLKAKQSSLEETKNSLIELKNRGGSIDEMIRLENRILEIEKEIQALGVSLGDYDAENEFCTIQFGLTEVSQPRSEFMYRILTAFSWTVKYYVVLTFSLLFLTATAFFAVKVIKEIKKLKKGKE
ncbi:DUF4349 domain-containing protein [Candidatus Dojkabacteria bacterium]|nr:DUF4349 domain-containing protein [Candidatus Dojkabacteria bacterium]